MKHLEGLNERQKEAVLHKDGPLLIIAGAGAGKTKTLTHRILNLIKEGVNPGAILAITFTNKAAKEMRDRVSALFRGDESFNFSLSGSEMPLLSTFHSLGVSILRENGDRVGVTKNFTILDDGDSMSLVKQAVADAGLDPKQFEPRRMKNAISKKKGDGVNSFSFAENVGNEYFPKIVSKVWSLYEESLKKQKSLDFDDLLLKTYELLTKHEDIKKSYQNRWRYVHIDEYQDTNVIQYELSKLLSESHKNICVVGDMDQSIYSWRGADFRNILNFEKDYPDAKVVLLEENYRSTKNILDAANEIIKKNRERKDKKLFTSNPEGEKIGLFEAYDEADEAKFVSTKITELIKNGASPKDVAVLYRANFQSRALEEAMIEANLPYKVLGVRFFDRKEVKDVLSFIRATLNPDGITDIKRVINIPPRGIGKVTLAKMFSGKENELPAKTQEKIKNFRDLLSVMAEKSTQEKPSQFIRFVIQKTGIEDLLKKGNEEDKERLENIMELATLAIKYDSLPPGEGLQSLLSDATLSTDQDSLEKDDGEVKLMTVHASKGLEFKYVFVIGLEQDLFPHSNMGRPEASEDQAEEERRLFYVAITRAEEKLFLSYASMRTIFGSKQVNIPSEFLADISDSLFELETRGSGRGTPIERLKTIYFD